MVDNLTQLDQSGTNAQFVRTYLGPTLGWVMVPVVPELIIISTAPLVLGLPGSTSYASRVLLNAAVTSVTLPSVAQWMNATLPLANNAGFDRSIWVKDLGGNATVSPITFTPFGTDTIDTLGSWQMSTAYDLVQFYPLTDLSGWYTNS
jgi:hypothetical protein